MVSTKKGLLPLEGPLSYASIAGSTTTVLLAVVIGSLPMAGSAAATTRIGPEPHGGIHAPNAPAHISLAPPCDNHAGGVLVGLASGHTSGVTSDSAAALVTARGSGDSLVMGSGDGPSHSLVRSRAASMGAAPEAEEGASGVRATKKAKGDMGAGAQPQQAVAVVAVTPAGAAPAPTAAMAAGMAAAAAAEAGRTAAAAATATASASGASKAQVACASVATAAPSPPQCLAGRGCVAGPSLAHGSGSHAGPSSLLECHSSVDSKWRDWVNHPEAVTAIWPRVLASGMPPASCLALLGTCRSTRNAVLLEAPRAKLTVQLGPAHPTPGPLLRLIEQSGRTQPTTLALPNSTTGQPAAAPSQMCMFQSMLAPPVQTPVNPHTASTNAQCILSHSTLLGCITRLDLTGVEASNQLFQAMQGLPALTHLDLSSIQLPSVGYRHSSRYFYQSASLPQGLLTLSIQLDAVRQRDNWQPTFTSLLTQFLLLDTITDLTVLDGLAALELFNALEMVTAHGQQAGALRKLCLPESTLQRRHFRMLVERGPPALEVLQVWSLIWQPGQPVEHPEEHEGHEEVSWRTLHINSLDVGACHTLPLGGTQPLDIHVSSNLILGSGGGTVVAGAQHLTSQQTRPVRLMGKGMAGGEIAYDGTYSDSLALLAGLSVLQLSTTPVQKLDIRITDAVHAEQLPQALQRLPAVTHVTLRCATWGGVHVIGDQLLARLPLHVTHVLLGIVGQNMREMGTLERFSRMAVNASQVPGRQAHPLHLWVVGVGSHSEVREAVEECRAQGHMGVVMEAS